MSDLRTDFKDDVLNVTTNEKRKYRMINNPDGTISFEDVTDYVQQGDTFGASEVNQITEKVNSCLTRQDVVNNLESDAADLPASANAARALNNKITDIYTRIGGFKRTWVDTNGASGLNTISKDSFGAGCIHLVFIRVAVNNNDDYKPTLFLISVANDKSTAKVVPLSIDSTAITSYSWNANGLQFNNAHTYGCKYAVYLVV